MSSEVRVAVIGAGVMGANHARVVGQLPGAKLTVVVDPDLERAGQAARSSGSAAVTTIDDVPSLADLAILAVPTDQHESTAISLAEAGVHLLVEKPLAGSVAAAQRVIDCAAAAGVILAVGHIERFNAAVSELPRLLDEPIHIEASRISPYSPRISDGVIFDLMIHDIDIVCSLFDADVTPVAVSGVARAVRGTSEDLASVSVTFSNGITATFNTSRLGQQKIRKIEITQRESVILADLVRQDVTVHRMSRHEYLSEDGVRYRQSSVIETPFLETRGEPLSRELQDVLSSVRNGTRPLVGGSDGLRAIALATQISSAVQRS